VLERIEDAAFVALLSLSEDDHKQDLVRTAAFSAFSVPPRIKHSEDCSASTLFCLAIERGFRMIPASMKMVDRVHDASLYFCDSAPLPWMEMPLA
jgi:hypothetical protein